MRKIGWHVRSFYCLQTSWVLLWQPYESGEKTFTYVQGSFRLFCRHKFDFSKSLANNLECNMKKLMVTGSGNFTNNPNCLQAFLFQRHLMMVIYQNDVVKHDGFQLPSFLINIHLEIIKTVEFKLEYINGGDLVGKEIVELTFSLRWEK